MNYHFIKQYIGESLKRLLGVLMEMEGINLMDYDMDRITCYRTIGGELNGKNVMFNQNCVYSPWVNDNPYEVFEIPSLGNRSKIKSEGSYFILAHNTAFNYWIAGKLVVSINTKSIFEKNRYSESISFNPFGLYEIGGDNSNTAIVYKKKSREHIDCGFPLPHKFQNCFDSLGARKKAYNLTEPKIIFILTNRKENKKFISDTNAVKIYKKNKNYKPNNK